MWALPWRCCVAYALYLLFMLKTHPGAFAAQGGHERTPKRASAGVSRAQSGAWWPLPCLRLG